MINLLGGIFGSISNFFGKIGNIIIYGLILILVIYCIILLSKYETTRKFLVYFIAIVICASGIYCSFGLYDELTSSSYVNGSFESLNNKREDSFYFETNYIIFNQDSEDVNKYLFSKDLDKVKDFNADENKYIVYFNDYEIIVNLQFTPGSIYFSIPFEFLNTEGNNLTTFDLHISIKFLSSKTQLSMWVFQNENYQYLSQYINDFGFRLKVEKVI